MRSRGVLVAERYLARSGNPNRTTVVCHTGWQKGTPKSRPYDTYHQGLVVDQAWKAGSEGVVTGEEDSSMVVEVTGTAYGISWSCDIMRHHATSSCWSRTARAGGSPSCAGF